MEFSALLIAGGLMLALGLVLSAVLALANKKLHVAEDPRIEQVAEMLPQANCGACGYAGCHAFAEVLVEGGVSPGQCPAMAPDEAEAIGKLLGVEVSSGEKRLARLACAGDSSVAENRAYYEGLPTCRAASLVGGGPKGCVWGCLGMGDCRDACPFDAIALNDYGLPIVDEGKCTACGACVTACPRDLFSIHAVSHRLWVPCKNEAPAKEARAVCAVACIGCGLCAKDAAEGLITIERNLARVDYDKNELASMDAIQRCPTGAIVWLDPEEGVIKGEKARQAEAKRAEKAGAAD